MSIDSTTLDSIHLIRSVVYSPRLLSGEYLPGVVKILFDSANWLGRESVSDRALWLRLKPEVKADLVKFVRLVQKRIFGCRLTGSFWAEAIKETASWSVSAKTGVSWIQGTGYVHVEMDYSTLVFQYNLGNGLNWRCVVNPHEGSEMTIPGQGTFTRLTPKTFVKENLYPVDAVIGTSFRQDEWDIEAASFFTIYQPAFFFPVLTPAHYTMKECKTGSALDLTYFPPKCKKMGLNHSGSWVLSFPLVKKTAHMLILGRAECCIILDVWRHCVEIKERFPEMTTVFVPKGSLLDRADYGPMMDFVANIFRPCEWIETHKKTWQKKL